MAKQHDAQHATALDLVGRVYEAAADPGLWPQFLNAFADATNSEGTVIWLHDTADTSARIQDPDASFVRNVRIEAEFLKSYAEHYTHTNVLLKEIAALPEGAMMLSSSIVPDAEFRRTEYYSDWLHPQGVGYCLGGPILKRGSTVAMFSASRLEQQGRYRDSDLRLTQLLMPHLRRACLLHQRLTRLHAERSGALAALELLPTAVWLLDARGRLLFANRAGRELDGQRDGIWLDRDGRPLAADPGQQQALQRVLAAMIAAGMGLGVQSDSALRITRRRQPAPLQVMVYPLGRDALLQGSAAAMFIFDPARSTLPDIDALRLLYGLTRTEAQLTVALARGDSLDDYCQTNGVTANTARTHLKHVLAKTGTRRQAQLVSLVASCSVRYAR